MKKILLVKTSSMGDIIQTLVALSDAKANQPDLILDWVVEEDFAEIPLWHKVVRKAIPIALRRWRKNFLSRSHWQEIAEFKRELRAESYDYIVDAQGLLKSALVTLMARGEVFGYGFGSVREPLASLFYRHKYAAPKDQHAMTRVRRLFADILGYSFDFDNYSYGVDLARLAKPEVKLEESYLVFVHGASRADKCWDENKWKSLVRLAGTGERRILLPWGNQEEKDRAERIAAGCSWVQVLPRLNLSEIGSIISLAKGVVSVDTGLAHLAAALNIPAVVLYGPTDPGLIGTTGKAQIHLKNFKVVAPEQVLTYCRLW